MDIQNHPFDDIADVRCQLAEAGEQPGQWGDSLNEGARISADDVERLTPDNWVG